MDISNIQVKVSMTKGADVGYETWHKVFNQWIPDPVDDILIDVADYSHVPDGPVALLAGHYANYAVDRTGGTLGFAYKRKKPLEGSLTERLHQVLRYTLQACVRLEKNPLLADRISFAAENIEIALNDRLAAPNSEGTAEAVQPDLDEVLSRLLGGTSYDIDRIDDPRKRLTFNIRAHASRKPAQLLDNLKG